MPSLWSPALTPTQVRALVLVAGAAGDVTDTVSAAGLGCSGAVVLAGSMAPAAALWVFATSYIFIGIGRLGWSSNPLRSCR